MPTTSHEPVAASELTVMRTCQKLNVRYVSRFFRPRFLRNYNLMSGLFVSRHSADSGACRRQSITILSPLAHLKVGLFASSIACRIQESEQLTEVIKRLLMDPEWAAEASPAPEELTNKAHCCGITARVCFAQPLKAGGELTHTFVWYFRFFGCFLAFLLFCCCLVYACTAPPRRWATQPATTAWRQLPSFKQMYQGVVPPAH